MRDSQKEIAKKYMLPERPFVYGMASAFDLFGTLNQGKREQLLANLQEDFRQSDKDIMRTTWRTVGECLLKAMDQYDKAAGESSA